MHESLREEKFEKEYLQQSSVKKRYLKNGFKTPQPQRSKHPGGNDYHNQSLLDIRQPQFNDSEKKENQMIINGKKE